MTLQDAIDKFNVLQDKYGSPSLVEAEIVSFLDMAQQERLNRLFPDDMGGVVNFEQDENVFSNLKGLIYYLVAGYFTLTPNGKGAILAYVDIDAEIDALSYWVDGSAKLFRILNIDYNDIPVRYTKHNNLLSNQTNIFKNADPANPRYTLLSQGIQFYPSTIDGADLELTVVKKPDSFFLIYNDDPLTEIYEWDDYNMNLVIMISLQLAGISTRDEELLVDIRNTQTTK
jgi:hypothetical protein